MEKILKDINNNPFRHFWIRNDDVSCADENYVKIISLYKKYNIPVIICAIPSIIEMAALDLVKENPLFEVSQHGYSHKNYAKQYDKTYKGELIKERNKLQILTDMLSGKHKLEELCDREIDILTPPYSFIDKEVEELLNPYYKTLSMFSDNSSLFSNDLNPCVDVINWKSQKLDIEKSKKKILEAMQKYNSIGICIHHNFLKSEDFIFIEELLKFVSKSNEEYERRLIQ